MKKRINHQARIADALERIADSVEMQNAIPRNRFASGGYIAGPKPNIQTPDAGHLPGPTTVKLSEKDRRFLEHINKGGPAVEPMTEFDE